MAQYFILLPGDTEEAVFLETHLIGESSFTSFYAGTGFKVLKKIIENKPELMPDVRIISDENKRFSVEEFLEILKSFRIYTN
jgi:hypothetical protein